MDPLGLLIAIVLLYFGLKLLWKGIRFLFGAAVSGCLGFTLTILGLIAFAFAFLWWLLS